MTSLKALASKKVLVLKINSTLREAARAMDNKSVGCALISDGKGHIVGLVTDRDIACRGVGLNYSPSDEIGKLVRKDLIFINESRTLPEATELMREFGIRRLPVIKSGPGGKNKCVGILSFDDLVFSGVVANDDLAEIIRSQFPRAKNKAPKNFSFQKIKELFFLPKEQHPIITP